MFNNFKTINMKNLFFYSFLVVLITTSCGTIKKVSPILEDDVYSSPKEYRAELARLDATKKQQEQSIAKRHNDSISFLRNSQMQKDANNPYYQDREFSYDDYYDYEYATRLKRFNNDRINGLSYYDNYYTNSYWYNQNPHNYGVSVYNGYSWWGNSYNNYSYNPSLMFYQNMGWGNGFNSGFMGYNPYNPYNNYAYWQGYNNGFQNGWMNGAYGYGYPFGGYNGFNNYPYNNWGYNNFGYNNFGNNWGYFNSFDNNSRYTYAPRTSHGGGNGQRTSNPGVVGENDSYYERHISSVASQQDKAVKFSELPTVRVNEVNAYQYNSSVNTILNNSIKNTPYSQNANVPIRNSGSWTVNEDKKTLEINPSIRNNNQTINQTGTVKQPINQQANPTRQGSFIKNESQQPQQTQPQQTKPKIYTAPDRQINRFESPSNNNNNYSSPPVRTPSGGNGSSRPR